MDRANSDGLLEHGRPSRLREVELALLELERATIQAQRKGSSEIVADDGRVRASLASSYARPSEVLHDPKLSAEQKRDLLRQWALNAYRIEVSATERMASSASSQLDEAIDALIDLDGGTASLSKLRLCALPEKARRRNAKNWLEVSIC